MQQKNKFLSVLLSAVLAGLLAASVAVAASTVGTNLSTTGTLSVTLTSTLTGNVTAAGDLAVNGGDITTAATTWNFDLPATGGTILFRDGANNLMTIADGGSVGNATITGTLGVTGNFAVNTDKFAVNATTGVATLANGETISNATNNLFIFATNTALTDTLILAPFATAGATFSGTITSADLTADKTWTFPDATGTVLLTTSGTTSVLTSSTGATFTFGPATDDQLIIDPVVAGGAAFTGTLTSADLTGANKTWTLPDATGTVALTANKLNAFAATTSAELLGVISDEQGSGALVFASSPTLVTPVLGAATATSINLGGTTLLDALSATTAAIDLVSAGANTCVTDTSTAIAQTTALGDTVIVTPSADDAAWDIGSLTAFVETAGTPGTVKIVYCNNSAGASDPASMTYRITVLQF